MNNVSITLQSIQHKRTLQRIDALERSASIDYNVCKLASALVLLAIALLV